MPLGSGIRDFHDQLVSPGISPARSADTRGARIYRSVASELAVEPYRDTILPVSDRLRNEVAGLLLSLGVAENERYIVMHAGAKRQTNRWPAERFARVADEIIRRWGHRVLLTGSPSEFALVERVAGIMGEKPVVLCGRISLPQMAALLAGSALYVGNDTGPMHLAAAVGTPVVSIFSARDFPEKWYPSGAGHSVLRHDVPCSPCFKELCDKDNICLTGIEADDVLLEVGRRLKGAVNPRAGLVQQIRSGAEVTG